MGASGQQRWQRQRKKVFDAVSHANPGILWKREIVTFCRRLEEHGLTIAQVSWFLFGSR
jgi:hypothetical protein